MDNRLSKIKQELIRRISNLDDAGRKQTLLDTLERLAYNPGIELYEDYQYPVPIEEWIEDDYFIGGALIWDTIKEDIINFFTNHYEEAIITGGTRSGKSFFTVLCLARMLYELSHMIVPQTFLNLSPSSNIYIANFSTVGFQAKEGIYSELRNFLEASPYFRENFQMDDKVKSMMRFPKMISFLPSGALSEKDLGLNVVSGVFDEANAVKPVKNSVRSSSALETFDMVAKKYEKLALRTKGTTLHDSSINWPFRNIVLGSHEFEGDYTERRMEVHKDDPQTFIRVYRAYETRNKTHFMSQKFRIDLGNTFHSPKILKEDDEPRGEVIEIPMNYWREANLNLPGLLKSSFGFITKNKDNLYFNTERMRECFIRSIEEHPYTLLVETSKFSGKLIPEKLLIKNKKPINPSKIRYVHVDMSKKICPLGICIGHCSGWKDVFYYDYENEKEIKKSLPITYIDLILQVDPRGIRIDASHIRKLILNLRAMGFKIKYVSGDQFYFGNLIELEKFKFIVEELSLDRKRDPYHSLRNSFDDGRVNGYEYQPIIKELARMEESEGFAIHPPGGTKDISDALAAVNWHINTKEKYSSIPASHLVTHAGRKKNYVDLVR